MKNLSLLLILIFIFLSCGKSKKNENTTNDHNINNIKENDTSTLLSELDKKKEINTNDAIIKIPKEKEIVENVIPENTDKDKTGIILENTEYLAPFFGIFEKNEYKKKLNYHNLKQDTSLSYTDKNNKKYKIPIFGESWDNTIYTENIPKIKEKINKGLNKLNFKILFKDKNRVLATVKDKENIFFVDIHYNSNKIFFYSYYKRILPENKIINIKLSREKSNIVFNAKFDGKHYYYIKVKILKGKKFNINIVSNFKNKSYQIITKKDTSFDIKNYEQYQILDLSQYTANNKITLNTYEKDIEASIQLIKTPYKIEEIKNFNGKLGAIKIKNVSSTKVMVKQDGYNSSKYSITGDKMPNGDALFWLPAGHYSIITKNLKQSKDNKAEMQTNLIPVESNKITEVNWPLYLDNINKEENSKDIKSTNVRLSVYKIEKIKDIVSVDLSLSNLPKGININKENFNINETRKLKAKAFSLKRIKTAMNIVILLDSSGSMKGNMKTAIKAVEKFIKKLPKNAKITLIDFDTKVKIVKSKNIKDLIKKLNKVKANGATALYDSVLKGIKLLKDKDRASIILFTDGKDANYNDTKRGSKANFEEMYKKVQKYKTPIYPIAFGKGADKTTLTKLAKTTKTKYHEGNNKESLDKIFTSIENDLGNAYRLKYKRPKKSITINSDTPIINFMIDRSGSMNGEKSWCEGCSYRIEDVKNILSSFISIIPDNFLIQFNTFNTDISINQIMTQSKAKILYAIGKMPTGGGTDIIKAIEKGLDFSNMNPSNNKYFIFVTDGAGKAFEFDENKMKRLRASLAEFKENNIKTFWIGLVESKKGEEMLAKIANLSGGEYLITKDLDKVKEKFKKISEQVSKIKENNEEKEERVKSLQISFRKKNTKDGDILTAINSSPVDFEILKEKAKKEEVRKLDYKLSNFDTNKLSYNNLNATEIYGSDTPLKDVRLTKVIPLKDNDNKSISYKNKAVNISLHNAFLFSRLKGIDAPYKQRFLVLKLSLENILKAEKVAVLENGEKHPSAWLNKSNENYKYKMAIPSYMIPDLKSHIFIRVNNSYELAFSKITWALEKPLVEINENKLVVNSKEKKEGLLAFKIGDKPIESLSLHLYDTTYGHMDIPIIGVMETKKEEINKLNKKGYKKLSDNFSIKIESEYLKKEIKGFKAKKNAVFDILELNLKSNINALLKLSPSQRFFMKIETNNGDFIVKAHKVSKLLPMGLFEQISLAPGSNNKFRIAFHIPENLKDNKRSLFIELKGSDLEILIKEKTNIKNLIKNKKPLKIVKKDGIKLKINNIYHYPEGLAIDITFDDKKDGNSTRIKDALMISKYKNLKDYSKIVDSKKEIKVHKKGLGSFSNQSGLKGAYKWTVPSNKGKILEYNNSSVILDGTKNRFIVIFNNNNMEKDKPYYLISPIFKDLSVEIDNKKIKKLPENLSYFKVENLKINFNNSYEKDLKKLLKKIKAEKIAKGKLKTNKIPLLSLDKSEKIAKILDPISISVFGADKLGKIKKIDDLIKEIKKLKYMPSYYKKQIYSKNSVFTQGYAGEYEMRKIIYDFVRRLNIEIELGQFDLSPKGLNKLKKKASLFDTVSSTTQVIKNKTIPYIKWGSKSMIFPFLITIEEGKEFIKLDNKHILSKLNYSFENFSIRIKLEYKKTYDSTNKRMGGIASALGGNQKVGLKKTEIFNRSFYLNKASDTPIDIWFKKSVNKKGKKIIKTFFTESNNIKTYKEIDRNIIPKKLVIEIDMPDKDLDKYTYIFKNNKKLENLFFTISVASPDLPKESLSYLDKKKKEIFKNIKKITELSLLQWLNRDKIYKFIGIQSKYEAELSQKLKLKYSRMKTPRVIIAKIEKANGKIISSLDLRSVSPDVYGDKLDIKSFNIMSGFMATEAEANVINGKSVASIWRETDNLGIITMLPKFKKDNIKYLNDKKISKEIIKRLSDSKRIWLFPSNFNKNKFGWFEIDSNNYKLISVLNTQEYGSMSEYAITEENVEATTRYFLGLLIGTDIAVGSVINASLMISNYKSMKAQAMKLAKVLACYVKKIESFSQDVIGNSKEALKDGVKDKLKDKFRDEDNGNLAESIRDKQFKCKGTKEDDADEKAPKKYSDYINFGKGIDHAISNYFQKMK